ncbi:MAG: glycosyltransferase family 2 protein [Lachnospiraceae bacterium]|nr:glycosyltransferase family 2 protein [Lachnospiraceae bacterium]
MSDMLSSVDVKQIVFEDEVLFLFYGWIYMPGYSGFSLKVVSNTGEKIPAEVTFVERPDIIPVLVGANLIEKPGFFVRIKNLPSLFDLPGWKLTVEACGVSEILYESTGKALKEEYEDKTFRYNVERMDLLGQMVVIQGWAVDLFRHDGMAISVKDDNGKEIHFRNQPVVRLDVNKGICTEEYPMEDARCGFNLTIKKDDCRTRHLYLQMGDEQIGTTEVFDMRKFLAEHSSFARLREALKDHESNRELIRDKGVGEFVNHLRCKMDPFYADYSMWVRSRRPGRSLLEKQSKKRWKYEPKISIVIPLYNTPLKYLKELMDSLVNQSYQNIEICLADGSTVDDTGKYIKKHYGKDSRVLYQRLKENKGISWNTNQAIAMATGDFIMLSDHDDVLERNAVYEIVKAINADPKKVDIVYTDEDKVTMDGKSYFEPNFKPEFNLDFFRSSNYICHIFVVRKTTLDQAGLFRSEYDGAQDFDLILRCTEQARVIRHVPKVLYHWRSHPASTAENPDSKMYAFEAGRKALQEHYNRLGIDAQAYRTEVFGRYRTEYALQGNPLISIIIPNKDHIDDLDKCLKSIYETSTYKNFEIVVVENNSTDPETFRYYKQLEAVHDNVRIITWKHEFNYAAIHNFAVPYCQGEQLLLLNNDTSIITPDWMEQMLQYAQRGDVGAVGAKLYFPDDTIQHAGVIIGMGGVAGHIFSGTPRAEYGYQARLISAQDLSAVTAACMMIPKAVYEAAGGFDERFKVAFNDVDLCMKIRSLDKKIVFTPYAELYHYESKSRGREEETSSKMKRFQSEVRLFKEKWPEILKNGDPYYSVNMALDNGNCTLRK